MGDTSNAPDMNCMPRMYLLVANPWVQKVSTPENAQKRLFECRDRKTFQSHGP